MVSHTHLTSVLLYNNHSSFSPYYSTAGPKTGVAAAGGNANARGGGTGNPGVGGIPGVGVIGGRDLPRKYPGINAGVGGNPVYGKDAAVVVPGGVGNTGTGSISRTGAGDRGGGVGGGGGGGAGGGAGGTRTDGSWVGLGPGRGYHPVTGNRNNGVPSPHHPRYSPPVNRDKDGTGSNVHVNGVSPDVVSNNDPETEIGYKPRNYDPVMAFVSSATAAIGVLTLSSTILGIYLLHRRQQPYPGAGFGKHFDR